ncbi:MAG TPA: hypothetical protein VFD08_02070 [Clostridia bacterium]|nr:hypothetical protein [Clostridia bacterium]
MKKSWFLILLILLLVPGAISVCKNKEEAVEGFNLSKKSEKKAYSQDFHIQPKTEKPKKTRQETALKKPKKTARKIEEIFQEESQEPLPEKEESKLEKAQGKEAGEKEEERDKPVDIPKEENALINRNQSEVIEEKTENKREEGFVFEPYYSAPIGSQGLFSDSDSATDEGWRISEMDNPSEYLTFVPKGWEVYPVWYYTSPDEFVVFYTLNFYD